MNRTDATSDWQRLRSDVRRLVGRRASSPADAEDVVQEVLARVWRHAATLRDDERFISWVRRIVDNTLADHLRLRLRHPLLPAAPVTEMPAPVVENPLDSGATSAKDRVAGILRPFAEALPEPYKEALILSELEGLTHARISTRLGVSVSAVKSRVRRGRAMLRRALALCCEIALDARNAVVSCETRPNADVPAGCCETGKLSPA